MNKKFISLKLYKKITAVLPLACVDLVVVKGSEFLLAKRKENPAKGEWWFPGGRILFNEEIEGAVRRKLKEELNIEKPLEKKFLGIEESMFKRGYFNKPTHTITFVYLIKISEKEGNQIKVNKTLDQYQWFSKIKNSADPYLKSFLKKAELI